MRRKKRRRRRTMMIIITYSLSPSPFPLGQNAVLSSILKTKICYESSVSRMTGERFLAEAGIFLWQHIQTNCGCT
jgi:hypothetical protein